jgi:hypothetical protein
LEYSSPSVVGATEAVAVDIVDDVEVGVAVGRGDCVGVAVTVSVAEGAVVGVEVGVSVAEGEAVGDEVGLAVEEGESVGVGDGDALGEGDAVGVEVEVDVGLGQIEPAGSRTLRNAWLSTGVVALVD